MEQRTLLSMNGVVVPDGDVGGGWNIYNAGSAFDAVNDPQRQPDAPTANGDLIGFGSEAPVPDESTQRFSMTTLNGVSQASEVKVWVFEDTSSYWQSPGMLSVTLVIGGVRQTPVMIDSCVGGDDSSPTAWRSATFTGSWSQTELDAMEVELIGRHEPGDFFGMPWGGSGSNVYALYAQVTYDAATGNNAPAAAGDAYSVRHDATLVKNAAQGVLANDTDAESQPLTAALVSGPSHGTLQLNGDGSFSYVPDAGFVGQDSFTYRADDGQQANHASAPATVALTVTNAAPSAPPREFTIAENSQAGAVVGTVAATEADADPVAFAITGGNTGGAFSVHAASGQITVAASEALDYEARSSFELTMTATDSLGAATAFQVVVHLTDVHETNPGGTNTAPVAVADAYTLPHDRPFTRGAVTGVLANDLDDQGDALAAALVPGQGPSHGTLALGGDGSFLYTPDAGYVGDDQFQYRASDGALQSDAATVALHVVNHAPVAVAADFNLPHDAADGAVVGTPTASDPEDDALLFAIADGNADGMFAVNPSTGRITLADTAHLSQAPTRTLTIRATDTAGGLDEALVTIHVTGLPNSGGVRGLIFNDIDNDGVFDGATPLAGGVTEKALPGWTAFIDANGNGTWDAQESFAVADSQGRYEFTGLAPGDYAVRLFALSDWTRTGPLKDIGATVHVGGAPVEGVNLGVRFERTVDELDADSIFGPVPLGSWGTVPGGFGNDHAEPFMDYVTLWNEWSFPGLEAGVYRVVVTVPYNPWYPVHEFRVSDIVSGDALGETVSVNPGDASAGFLESGVRWRVLSVDAQPTGSGGSRGLVVRAESNEGMLVDAARVVRVDAAPPPENPASPTNTPPTSQADSYTLTHDRPLARAAAQGVLANDGDAQSQPMTAVLVSGPSHGALELHADGSFTYAPDTGYVGADAFTYRADDGQASDHAGEPATVSLTITNTAPAAGPHEFTQAENSPQGTVVGVVTATDSDGDPLTFALTGGNDGGTFAIDPNTGRITVADPAALDFETRDTWVLAVAVADDAGATANVNVVVHVGDVNEPSGPVGSPVIYGLIFNDIDHDGVFGGATPLAGGVTEKALPGWTAFIDANGNGTWDAQESFAVADSLGRYEFAGLAPGDYTVSVSVPAGWSRTGASAGGGTAVHFTGVALAGADLGVHCERVIDELDAGATFGPIPIQSWGVVSGGYGGDHAEVFYDYVMFWNEWRFAGLDAGVYRVEVTVPDNAWYPVHEFRVKDLASDAAIGSLTSVNPGDTTTGYLDAGLRWRVLGVDAQPTGSGASRGLVVRAESSEGMLVDAARVVRIDAAPPPVSPPPNAHADEYTLFHGRALSRGAAAGVLANDVNSRPGLLSAALVPGHAPAHGTLDLAADGSFVYTPDAGFLGDDSFQYRATNGESTSEPATVALHVTNTAPAAAAESYSLRQGRSLWVEATTGVLANDADLESDTLLAQLVDAPSHGTLDLAPDGSLLYTPAPDFAGDDAFTYIARDALADSAAATVTLHVAPDRAPVGADDGYVVLTGVPYESAIAVLANDTDADNDALTVTLLSPPAHGGVTLTSGGVFTFTPAPGAPGGESFIGQDGFTYELSDGFHHVGPVTVSLDIVAPAALHGTLYNDADGDDTRDAREAALSGVTVYVDLDGDASRDATEPAAVTDAQGGFAIAGLYPGAAAVRADARSEWTLTSAPIASLVSGATTDVGAIGVGYSAQHEDSGPWFGASENWAVVTDPATGMSWHASEPFEGPAWASWRFEGLLPGLYEVGARWRAGYDSAAEFRVWGLDSLTALTPARETDQTVVSGGTSAATLARAVFARVYIPPADANVEVRLDSDFFAGGAIADAVYLRQVGVPPTTPAAGGDDYSVSHDKPLTLAAAAGVLANDGDADLNALSARLLTPPAHGALTLRDDGSFDYTPEPGYVGLDGFTYAAANGVLESVATAVTLHVVNAAPGATPDLFHARPGRELAVPAAQGVLANDADGDADALTTSVVTPAAHGVLSLNPDGSFSYAPDEGFVGDDSFIYQASDTLGLTAIARVDLVVAANRAPQAGADSFTTVAGRPLRPALPLLSNDADADGDAMTASLVASASHGSVTLSPDGTFSYLPDPGYFGDDSFRYAAGDGESASPAATVTLHVDPAASLGGVVRLDLDADGSPDPDAFDSATAGVRVFVDSNGDGALNPGEPSAPTDRDGAFTIGGLPAGDHAIAVDPASGWRRTAAAAPLVVHVETGQHVEGIGVSARHVVTADDPQTVGAWSAQTIGLSGGSQIDPAGDDGHATWSLGTASPGVYRLDVTWPASASNTSAATLQLLAGEDEAPWLPPASLDLRQPPNGDARDGAVWQTAIPFITVTEPTPLAARLARASGGALVADAAQLVRVADLPAAPDAAYDSYALRHDQPLTVAASSGVLANDSHDSLPVSASPAFAPLHGSLTLNPDGSFAYTPDAGFVGADSFTYEITTLDGRRDTGMVVLAVESVMASPESDEFEVPHDRATLVPAAQGVLANDADNRDGLTVSLVSGTVHGDLQLGADGSFAYTPAPGFVGTDAFAYRVSDGATQGPAVVVTIDVVNRAPTAAGDAFTTTEDATLAASLLDNDTDADGDPLAIELVDPPSHGTLSLAPDGTFTYTPDADFNGVDTFTYRVTDGVAFSSPATATVQITPVNDAPTPAQPPSFDTRINKPITIPRAELAARFADIDSSSEAIAVAWVGEPSHATVAITAGGDVLVTPESGFIGDASFQLTMSDGQASSAAAVAVVHVGYTPPAAVAGAFVVATDGALEVTAASGLLASVSGGDGSPLSVALLDPPAHGDVAVDPSGAFTFTPDSGYVGPDSFTYAISDGTSSSSPVAVNLFVTNLQLHALPDDYSLPHDQTFRTGARLGVLRNDWVSSTLIQPTVAVVDAPSHGDLSILDPARGTFEYTPDEGFTGDDTFTYTASAAGVVTPPVTVTLRVQNTLTRPRQDSYTLAHDRTLQATGVFALLRNDVNPDGDDLIAQLAASPAHGSIEGFADDGSFVYVPAAGFVGDDSFTYTVSDGANATAPVTAVIHVTNAPAVAAGQAYRTHHDAPVSGNVLTTAFDPDGDALAATLDTAPAHGSLTLAPGGAFTYTPAPGYVGPDSFAFRAADGVSAGVKATVTLDVWDAAPIVNGESFNLTMNTQIGVTFDPLANDFGWDGDALDVFNLTQPAHGTLTVDTQNHSFNYKPATNFVGVDTFTYRVGSGPFLSSPVLVTINVNNHAPRTRSSAFRFERTASTQTFTGKVGADHFDADGHTLSIVPVTGPQPIVVNGQTVAGVAIDADGTFRLNAPGTYLGDLWFPFTITDGGGFATEIARVTFYSDAPFAASDVFQTPMNTPLAVGGSTGASVAVNDTIGSEPSMRFELASAPPQGSFTFNTDGTFTFTPPPNAGGAYSFEYIARSLFASSNHATATVVVLPSPATAVDDFWSLDAGSSLSENVRGNDVLPPAPAAAPVIDAIGVDADPAAGWSHLLNGSITQPLRTAHGNVTAFNADGTFTYAPDPYYHGPDAFHYRSLHAGVPTVAKVNLMVKGARPIAGPDSAGSTLMGTPKQILLSSLLQNDSDPEAPPQTSLSTYQLTIEAQPRNGQLVRGLNANGYDILTYTPRAGYFGPDPFQYSITSPSGLKSAFATVTLTVDQAVNLQTRQLRLKTSEDQSLSVHLADAFVDENNPTATVNLAGVSFEVAVQPRHGTIVNGTTANPSYQPEPNFNGDDDFVLRTLDPNPREVAVSVRVVPVNDAPAGHPDTIAAGDDGVAMFTLNGILANDTDADGPLNEDTIHDLSIQASGPGRLSKTPTGLYVFTFDDTGADTASLSYSARDLAGAEFNSTISVSRPNRAPIAAYHYVVCPYPETGFPKYDTPTGGPTFDIDVVSGATDPEGDPIHVDSVVGPLITVLSPTTIRVRPELVPFVDTDGVTRYRLDWGMGGGIQYVLADSHGAKTPATAWYSCGKPSSDIRTIDLAPGQSYCNIPLDSAVTNTSPSTYLRVEFTGVHTVAISVLGDASTKHVSFKAESMFEGLTGAAINATFSGNVRSLGAYATGNLGALSAAENLRATSLYGSIAGLSATTIEARAAGDINSVTATDRISSIQAGGSVGNVSAGGEISGIQAGAINGSITAQSRIGSIIVSRGDLAGSVSTPGHIDRLSVGRGNLTASISARSIDQLEVGGLLASPSINVTESLAPNRSQSGDAWRLYFETGFGSGRPTIFFAGMGFNANLTVGRHLGDLLVGHGDLSGSIKVGPAASDPANPNNLRIGSVVVPRNLIGSVIAQGPGAIVGSVRVGNDLSGSVTAASLPGLLIGNDITSTGSITAASELTQLLVKRDLKGRITAGRIGFISSLRAIKDAKIVATAGGVASITAGDPAAYFVTADPFGIHGSLISATGDINNVAAAENAALDASISGTTVKSLGGSIRRVSAAGAASALNINAKGNIDAVLAGIASLTPAGLGAQIVAGGSVGSIYASGTISGNLFAAETLGSAASAGAAPITAGLDITATLTATGSIGSVRAGRDITSQTINTTGGSIGNITAARDISSKINAATSLGDVTAGGNKQGGSIGGSIKAGGTAGRILARSDRDLNTSLVPDRPEGYRLDPTQINASRPLEEAILPPVNKILPLGDTGTGGNITADIQAAVVTGVTAYNMLKANVTAETYLQNLWAGGKVVGEFVSTVSSVALDAWGKAEPKIKSANAIIGKFYDDVKPDFDSHREVALVSLAMMGGPIYAIGAITLYAGADIAGKIISKNSGIDAEAMESLNAELTSGEDATLFAKTVFGGRNNAFGRLSCLAIAGYYADETKFGGSGRIITFGDINTRLEYNAPAGSNPDEHPVEVVAGGDIKGQIAGAGGDWKVAARNNIKLDYLRILGDASRARLEANAIDLATVHVNAIDLVSSSTIDLGETSAKVGITTSAIGRTHLKGKVNSDGIIGLTGAGDIVADEELKAKHGIGIQTFADLSAKNILVTEGNIGIDTSGDAAAALIKTEQRDIHITNWGTLDAPIISKRDLALFTAGDLTRSVLVGGHADIDAWGGVNTTITSGSLTLSAMRDIAGTVSTTDGDLRLASQASVTAAINSARDADIESLEQTAASITAGGNISLHAKNVEHGTELNAIYGQVNLVAYGSAEATISAAYGVTVTAGNVPGIDIDNDLGGTVSVMGLSGVASANIRAPRAQVSVYSGAGASDVTVAPAEPGQARASDVAITTHGPLTGSALATNSVAINALDSLSEFLADVNGGVSSAISVFSSGTVESLTAVSAGVIDVSAADAVTNSNLSAGGSASLTSIGKIEDTAIIARGAVSVASKDEISGSDPVPDDIAVSDPPIPGGPPPTPGAVFRSLQGSVSVIAEGGVSASIAARGSVDIVALGGDIDQPATAVNGDIDAFAGGSVASKLTAGQDVRLLTLDSLTQDISAGRDASISARNAISGDIVAGRDASVDSDAITGDVTAQTRNLSVFSKGSLASTLDAGGSAEIHTLSTLASTVHAAGDVNAYAAAGIASPNIGSSGARVSLTSAGPVHTNAYAAGELTLNTLGGVTGAYFGDSVSLSSFTGINAAVSAAAGGARLYAFGDIDGHVNSASFVVASSRGDFSAQVDAATSVDIDSLGGVNADIDAGGDLKIFAVADILGGLHSNQKIDLTTWGAMHASIDSGDTVIASAMGDITSTVHAHHAIHLDTTGNAGVHASTDDGVFTLSALRGVSGSVDAGDDVTVFAQRNVSLDATSRAGDIDITALGSASGQLAAHDHLRVSAIGDISSLIAQSDTGNVELSSGKRITATTVAADRKASILARGMISDVDVSARLGASLVSLEEITATHIFADEGEISLIAAGPVDVAVNSASAAVAMNATPSVEIATLGFASVQIDHASSVSISAAGNVSGVIGTLAPQPSGITGDLDVTALGSIYLTRAAADGDAVLTSANDIHANIVQIGGDLELHALADITGDYDAGRDATSILARGDINANISAGRDILSVHSYADINAVLHAGLTATDPAVGSIGKVVAWGDIDLTADANMGIGSVIAGGDADVTLAAASVGPVLDHVVSIRSGALPTNPLLPGQGVAELITQINEIARELDASSTSAEQSHVASLAQLAAQLAGVQLQLAQMNTPDAVLEATAQAQDAIARTQAMLVSITESDQWRAATAHDTVRGAFLQFAAAVELTKVHDQAELHELARQLKVESLSVKAIRQDRLRTKAIMTTIRAMDDTAKLDAMNKANADRAEAWKLRVAKRLADLVKAEITKTLDNIQLVLNIAEFFPVVGTAAAAVNMAIHIIRGNYYQAAMSAMALLPLVGKLGATACRVAWVANMAIQGFGVYQSYQNGDYLGAALGLGFMIFSYNKSFCFTDTMTSPVVENMYARVTVPGEAALLNLPAAVRDPDGNPNYVILAASLAVLGAAAGWQARQGFRRRRLMGLTKAASLIDEAYDESPLIQRLHRASQRGGLRLACA